MVSAGEDPAVVLFDGVCNLCNGLVAFLLPRDPRGRFRFAALQSRAGQQLLREYGLPTDDLDTFVLIEDGRARTRSTAALRVLARLGWPWRLAAVLLAVPRGVRDPVYRLVARYRYRWFGRREQCALPPPEHAGRFLD